ncbi:MULTISPECIES: hypothetical protein [Brevibacillus]|uniref:hypothetical protein n=1 Tax=Brevibacillus TaxID=55080 RepID=UPI000A5A731F|nr:MULTISPECIES: hypothetical protein [Brevibacillus]MDC0759716.1 hypothetical protein [Brevibacillus sp. AG]MED1800144.1 hypothetical protein [Brevibacillus porteri]MED2134554.1 hypothetical protein [Brevibacillus porteri]MED2747121.1 hypothetical protein [Brevibacillus porteri]MED2812515.1 hypothetical protein [Brevibacillus porteri]
MDLPKTLQDNHSKQDEEGQVIPNFQETKGSDNEERPIESWGWSNNTETVRGR